MLLIPNTSLETPNYTVTRLKHDELNQNDVTLPSYKMADIPAEAAVPSTAVQKPEAQRPQAAVQGITPAQPAPTVAPREEVKPSIFEKIFGWLTRKPEPAPEPVKARPREPQRNRDSARRDHRHGRPEGRGDGNKRDEPRRGPRQDADGPRRDQGRNRNQEQGERKPQQDRSQQPQQQQRPARQEPALAAVEQRQPGDRPAEGAREEGRSRRRGRGRRDRSENQENPNQQRDQPNRQQSSHPGNGQGRPSRERENAPVVVVQEDSSSFAAEHRPSDRSIADQPLLQQAVGEQPIMEQRVFEQPRVRENIEEEVARTVFVPGAVIQDQRPAPEPVLERPQAQPVTVPQQPAAPTPAPAWRMEPVALPSDLVMIETQAKPSASFQESEAPRPARTPRPRNQSSVVPDEPLQQVETAGKQQSINSDAAG